jgi:hypothetical protein
MAQGTSDAVLRASGSGLSVDAVSSATHPAIARAVEEILRGQHNESAFSNFVSHSSAVE